MFVFASMSEGLYVCECVCVIACVYMLTYKRV